MRKIFKLLFLNTKEKQKKYKKTILDLGYLFNNLDEGLFLSLAIEMYIYEDMHDIPSTNDKDAEMHINIGDPFDGCYFYNLN